MKLLFLFFAILCGAVWPTGVLKADTYPEVVFDNSLVSGVYAKSRVHYEGDSWVENLNKHLLVSDTLFFTPGNALSLQYRSGKKGTWNADIRYSRQKNHYQLGNTDVLVFKIFVKTEYTTKKYLPKIAILQQDGETEALDMSAFLEDFAYNTWVNVKIPLARFRSLRLEQTVQAIRFYQQEADAKTHHIFLDQIEFLPKNHSVASLSSAAILSAAEAYDKQVHLQWQLPLTPSIRYIKIYRSEDNKVFEPVDIRPISMQGCFNYVPEVNKTYYYKIAWVDYNYVESPFSEVKEVKTRVLSREQRLDLIQAAHVNYFLENYDINSGMYLPFRRKDKAVVSVKESGEAVLSLIVGVERGSVQRHVAFNRVSRMVFFLLKAQQRYGFFPAYFDGRTMLPDYRSADPSYDVLATATMMEALLVARQYFDKESEEETDLRNRITQLWQNVQWDKALLTGTEDVLVERISGLDTASVSSLKYPSLGGINASMNAYLLAMAAPKHRIPLTAYQNGIKKVQRDSVLTQQAVKDSVLQDTLLFVLNPFDFLQEQATKVDTALSLPVRESIRKDTVMYGEELAFGWNNESLLDLYKPFFTINPAILKDKEADYQQAIQNYIQVRKRKDNEIGVGSTHSDIWGFYQFRDSIGSFRINPAIAPSAMFSLKEVGQEAIENLYKYYGERLFTEYGFRAWLDLRNNDVSDEYFASNQAAVAVLIENARSGLIWKLYEEIPEIKQVVDDLFAPVEKKN